MRAVVGNVVSGLVNDINIGIDSGDLDATDGSDGVNLAQQVLLNSVSASVDKLGTLQSPPSEVSSMDYIALA